MIVNLWLSIGTRVIQVRLDCRATSANPTDPVRSSSCYLLVIQIQTEIPIDQEPLSFVSAQDVASTDIAVENFSVKISMLMGCVE